MLWFRLVTGCTDTLTVLRPLAFEITPEGIKCESKVEGSQSITPQTGRKLNNAITGLLVVALAHFILESICILTRYAASRDLKF